MVNLIPSFSSDELSDLEKQLNEGGLSVHELEKAKNKLEADKEELTIALEVCIPKEYVNQRTESKNIAWLWWIKYDYGGSSMTMVDQVWLWWIKYDYSGLSV